MIPKECKRLAEVDFPLTAVNQACRKENNTKSRLNSEHPSLFHTWWARRPLASSRAALLSLLLPDPEDENCPVDFLSKAPRILSGWRTIGKSRKELQEALVAFVAEAAENDLIKTGRYLAIARELVKLAHGDALHLFDPFSGGGSIPIEADRLGCEVTASDLNPVPWLLLKIALEWVPRYGVKLVEAFHHWSDWMIQETERRLSRLYPADQEGRPTLAYLWARTVRCEASGCGVTIPLITNLWLSESRGREKAIRIRYDGDSPVPKTEIFRPMSPDEVKSGTVSRWNATCPNPKCNRVTARERVQAQLAARRGGGQDALLFAVVRGNLERRGKDYYEPTARDFEAIRLANEEAKQIKIELPSFPQGDTRAFPPGPYGIVNWADVLTPRQLVSRWTIHQVIEDALKAAEKKEKDFDFLTALAACLYVAFSDNAQYHTNLCVWLSEGVKSIFIQGSGIPMRADFVEGSPLSTNCEGLSYSVESTLSALRGLFSAKLTATSPIIANVLDQILPDGSCQAVFTDPPYANQIPYAHLADFFYGWLRLGLTSRLPQAFSRRETEKALELTENRAVSDGGTHDRDWYHEKMKEAFIKIRRTLDEDGTASVIFAHKETDRWEALVKAMLDADWSVTGSWPILTERGARMRGQGYAALESSVHLICRPRANNAGVGDWSKVLRELPKRVGDWMERLQGEGIRGADLVFACIGPALEIFSRYSKVETAEGREVKLAEYLVKVWEVVGRSALEQILGTAEARVHNGTAGALEEDARLTALFLWTLQSSNSDSGKNAAEGKDTEEESDEPETDDEEETALRAKAKGYSLIFDVVRRFAQPLGIDLEKWKDRIIETEKGMVRLLPVTERAKQLFGKDGAQAVAEQIEASPPNSFQMTLFPDMETKVPPKIKKSGKRIKIEISGDGLQTDEEATTLDRVHAAMLFQASGQSNALRALLKAEQERGPEFLRLANALSALYPKESEEKRLLDAMLLAVPR